MKEKVMQGKPYAGNPHVRFDERAGAPRHSGRSALLYKDFEVGKFYKLQVSTFSSNLIPALCVRLLKHKIDFLYLSKDSSGKITKVKTSRRLQKATEYSHAYAYVTDTWSCIAIASADMETEKPKLWDSVEE